jgi:hypothetical protein
MANAQVFRSRDGRRNLAHDQASVTASPLSALTRARMKRISRWFRKFQFLCASSGKLTMKK